MAGTLHLTYPPHDVANASVTGQSNLGGGIAIGGVGNPRSWRLRLGSRRDRNRRLIRKLRWMGMEEEAERAQTELAECGFRPADSVLAAPRDTD